MRSFSFLIFVVAWAQILPAQTAPPADLDSFVAKALKTFQVPGLSVAIVKDGKTVLAKGCRVRKMGNPTPVDENTLFGIGSNTKAFTSAALATLVDEGKLSWDDRVYERLPGFQMYDPYVSHEMTIRDLLTHIAAGWAWAKGSALLAALHVHTGDIIHRLRFMKPAHQFPQPLCLRQSPISQPIRIIPAVTGNPGKTTFAAAFCFPSE